MSALKFAVVLKRRGEQNRAKGIRLIPLSPFDFEDMCTPMLANLFDLEGSNGKLVTATITDVTPDVFRHLLCYVYYGGSVSEIVLKKHIL